MSSLPRTMRAWTFNSRGPPTSTLKLTDLPTPTPKRLKPNEVLVKTSHVAFNVGLQVLFRLLPHINSNPWIPELESSGTIVAVGSAVTGLAPGDAVFGAQNFPTHFRHGGTLAEYLVMPAELVVHVPAGMSMAEASGIAGVGCTAVQVVEQAGLKRGDKVLVNGGSGGLGSMMVQITKAIVGESGIVVSTCSGPNVEMVKKLGADEVLDYTHPTLLPTRLASDHSATPFNAIIDNVGTQSLYLSSPTYLTPKGAYINLGGSSVLHSPHLLLGFLSWIWTQTLNRFQPSVFGGVPRSYRFYSATPTRPSMLQIKELVEAGKVRGVVDSVWSMEDAMKAYERVESQRAKGKVVVKVEPT